MHRHKGHRPAAGLDGHVSVVIGPYGKGVVQAVHVAAVPTEQIDARIVGQASDYLLHDLSHTVRGRHEPQIGPHPGVERNDGLGLLLAIGQYEPRGEADARVSEAIGRLHTTLLRVPEIAVEPLEERYVAPGKPVDRLPVIPYAEELRNGFRTAQRLQEPVPVERDVLELVDEDVVIVRTMSLPTEGGRLDDGIRKVDDALLLAYLPITGHERYDDMIDGGSVAQSRLSAQLLHCLPLRAKEEIEGRQHIDDGVLLPVKLARDVLARIAVHVAPLRAELRLELAEDGTVVEVRASRHEKDRTAFLMEVPLPLYSFQIALLLFRGEPPGTTPLLVDGEVLEVDAPSVSLLVGVIDGEVRTVLPEILVDGIVLVPLLIAERDAVAPEVIAQPALLVTLAEDLASVHILIVSVHTVLAARRDILLAREALELVRSLISTLEYVIIYGRTKVGVVVHQVVIHGRRKPRVGDGGFAVGRLADKVERELMEGDAPEGFLAESFGEGLRRLASEGDEKDLARIHALLVDKVTDLADGGHRLAGAGAADDKDVVLEGDDALALLGVERELHDRIEERTVLGELTTYELTVILLLVLPGVAKGTVEPLGGCVERREPEPLRAMDLSERLLEIRMGSVEGEPLRFRDVMRVVVKRTGIPKSRLYSRLYLRQEPSDSSVTDDPARKNYEQCKNEDGDYRNDKAEHCKG